MNSYINPIAAFKREGNYKINKEDSNFACYEINKSKIYAKEGHLPTASVPKQQTKENYSKQEFENNNNKKIDINLNDHHFYKNTFGNPIKQIVNSNEIRQKAQIQRTIISNDAPEWFNVINDEKLARLNNKLKNEETMTIFSRFQKWITVTPKHKNRKRPLEKEKITSMEKTSKIMPNWMQPNYSSKSNKIGHGKKNKVLFMEDSLKSVYSIMDYRHNVNRKEESEAFMSKVPQLPKKFFDHDDGTRFVVSKNKDVKMPQIK